MMITRMQQTILEIADDAKKNGINPIEAVKEYFDEKDSHFSRTRIVVILAAAREAERNK